MHPVVMTSEGLMQVNDDSLGSSLGVCLGFMSSKGRGLSSFFSPVAVADMKMWKSCLPSFKAELKSVRISWTLAPLIAMCSK